MGIGATFGNSCFGDHSRAQNDPCPNVWEKARVNIELTIFGTVVNHGSECKHIQEISQFIKDKNHQDPSYCHRNATCSFGKKHNIFVARSSSAIYGVLGNLMLWSSLCWLNSWRYQNRSNQEELFPSGRSEHCDWCIAFLRNQKQVHIDCSNGISLQRNIIIIGITSNIIIMRYCHWIIIFQYDNHSGIHQIRIAEDTLAASLLWRRVGGASHGSNGYRPI
jgi:hypothetical protein